MIKIKLGVKNYDPKLKELVDEKVYRKYKLYGELSESEAKKVADPLKDLIETLDKIQEKQTKEYEEERSKRKGKEEKRSKEKEK